MKKRILLLFVALCSLMVNAQDSIIKVPKVAAPITIDGEIDAAWSTAASFDVSKWGSGKPVPDASDFSASFKLLWDDDYLYFIGIIVDDQLIDAATYTDLGTTDWEVDNFEIYWSPGNSKLPDQTEMTQIRLAYANAGSDDPAPGIYSEGGFTLPEFVVAAKKTTDNGYIYEASFDLAVSADAAGRDPFQVNDTIGFNAVACDNDGDVNRENIGGIITGFKYNQADTLLRLVLSEITSSISQTGKNSLVRVYPNPTSEKINISNVANVKSIELINLNGQVVLKAQNPTAALSVSTLQRGLYQVKIVTNNGTINQKIVVR